MKTVFYGGAFDPIHSGHIRVALAAQQALAIERVLFAPNSHPPHKFRQAASYEDRAQMVSLAVASHAGMELCRAESPESLAARGREFGYSVETVEHLLAGACAQDSLSFLIGADAFADIAKWWRADELLPMCEFIVVSRPGFALEHALEALPLSLRGAEFTRSERESASYRVTTARGGGVTLHLLDGLATPESSTEARERARKHEDVSAITGRDVAQYIRARSLYC